MRINKNTWFVILGIFFLLLFAVNSACIKGGENPEKDQADYTPAEGEQGAHSHGEEGEHSHEGGEGPHTHITTGETKAEHSLVEGGEGHTHGDEAEHAHGEEGEESGETFAADAIYNKVREGVRLTLRFDASSSAFVGTMENTTDETIESVRVEVHLSNGKELGPTKSIDLAPGQKAPVTLPAEGQEFEWYRAHSESGKSEH